MGKNKNFTIQLNVRIDRLLAVGESKHAAKDAYRKTSESRGEKWNPAKSNFIHSCATADAYRQTVGEVCLWLKENKADVWSSKNLDNFNKEVAYEYLHSRENTGCSSYTVSKDMAALNKVLDLDLNKKEGCLATRSIDDVTRSRTAADMDTRYNPSNYSKQIEFAQAFGLRRESIKGGNYQVKDISLSQRDDKVYCSVIEKGGRYREAPCLEKYQDAINERYNVEERESLTKAEFKDLYSSSNDVLFDRYTPLIDNHAFRGEYARNLYNQISEQKEEVKADYRGFDKEIVREVSEALGHNRLNVVVEHYLR